MYTVHISYQDIVPSYCADKKLFGWHPTGEEQLAQSYGPQFFGISLHGSALD